MNGVYGTRNSNVLFDNVNINNFTNRGISIHDSSYLGVDEGGVNIQGNNAERGIYLSTGSSGWIYNAIISSVKRGIVIYGGSMTYINNFNITGGEVGISVSASKFLKYDNDGNGLGIIKNTSDRAIGVYDGVFTNWGNGRLEISDFVGGRGLDIDRSIAEIRHLTVTGNNSTDENLVDIRNSQFNIKNISLSESGRHGLNLEHSNGHLDNISIQNSNKSGLNIDGSNLNLETGDIQGSAENGIEVRNNSSLRGGWKNQEDTSLPQ